MYESKLKSEEVDRLFEAFCSLNSVEECYRFFDDLCTISEIKSMALRFQVAKLLSQGKTFAQIEEETKASSATITRVNRSLCYGADGYQRMIEKLNGKKA